MEYINIRDLKTELLHLIPIKEKEKRDKIKKSLAIPVLANAAIDKKETVAYGKDFTIAFEKNFLEDLIGLDLSKTQQKINNEDVTVFAVAEDMSAIYRNLNKYRKTGKKERKKNMTPEEKSALRLSKSQRNKDKAKHSLLELEKTLNSNDRVLFFDIEAYERKQSEITEIGYLIVQNKVIVEHKHLIIKENYKLRNGKYVPDHKEDFDFGESLTVPLETAIEIISDRINTATSIVGHGINNDFKYLGSHIPNIKEVTKTKKVINTSTGTFIFEDGLSMYSIKRSLDMFGQEYKNLHNAGNDAYFNYEVAKGLVSYKNTLDLLNKKEKEAKNKKTSKRGLKKVI